MLLLCSFVRDGEDYDEPVDFLDENELKHINQTGDIIAITIAICLNDWDSIACITQSMPSFSVKLASYALCFVVQMNRPEGVKALLEAKADTEAKYDFRNGEQNVTPLMLAATCKRKSSSSAYDKEDKGDRTIRVLLEAKAKLEACSQAGLTPIMFATIAGNSTILSALIKAKANLEAKTELGDTALIKAALYGYSCDSYEVSDLRQTYEQMMAAKNEVLYTLIVAKANLEAKNNQGETALSVACRWLQVESVRLLLEHGAFLQTMSIFDEPEMTELDTHSAFRWNDAFNFFIGSDVISVWRVNWLLKLMETVYLQLRYDAIIPASEIEKVRRFYCEIHMRLLMQIQDVSDQTKQAMIGLRSWVESRISLFFGVIFQLESKKAYAQEYYDKAIATVEKPTTAYRHKGDLYCEMKPDYALEQYKEALRLDDILAIKNIVVLRQALQKDASANAKLLRECDQLIYIHFLGDSQIRSFWLTAEQWLLLAVDILGNRFFRSSDDSDELGNSSVKPLDVVRLARLAASNAKVQAQSEEEKKEANKVLQSTLRMYMTLADPGYNEPHLTNEVGDTLLEFCDEATLKAFKSPKKEAGSQGLDEEIEVSSSSASSSTSPPVMQSSTSKLFEVLQNAIARKSMAEHKRVKESKPNIPVFKVPSNEDKSSEASSQTTREVSSSSSIQDLNAQAAHKSRMKYFGSLARYGVVSISTSKYASSDYSSQSSQNSWSLNYGSPTHQ